MTKLKNTLGIVAIKWILGDDFINGEDIYKVNIDISSWFVASTLYLGENTSKIILLTREVFPKHLLDALDEIVHLVVIGLGIPIAMDLRFTTISMK